MMAHSQVFHVSGLDVCAQVLAANPGPLQPRRIALSPDATKSVWLHTQAEVSHAFPSQQAVQIVALCWLKNRRLARPKPYRMSARYCVVSTPKSKWFTMRSLLVSENDCVAVVCKSCQKWLPGRTSAARQPASRRRVVLHTYAPFRQSHGHFTSGIRSLHRPYGR
jgi:hypothetical protein